MTLALRTRTSGRNRRARFRTARGLSSDKKSGRCSQGAAPAQEGGSVAKCLELEARADLYLAFAEERAVSAGDAVEAACPTVEVQERTRAGRAARRVN